MRFIHGEQEFKEAHEKSKGKSLAEMKAHTAHMLSQIEAKGCDVRLFYIEQEDGTYEETAVLFSPTSTKNMLQGEELFRTAGTTAEEIQIRKEAAELVGLPVSIMQRNAFGVMVDAETGEQISLGNQQ